VAARFTRAGIEKKLLIDDPARRTRSKAAANLQRLVARAYDLQRAFIAGGKPIAELAKEAGMTSSYYTRRHCQSNRLGSSFPALPRMRTAQKLLLQRS